MLYNFPIQNFYTYPIQNTKDHLLQCLILYLCPYVFQMVAYTDRITALVFTKIILKSPIFLCVALCVQ